MNAEQKNKTNEFKELLINLCNSSFALGQYRGYSKEPVSRQELLQKNNANKQACIKWVEKQIRAERKGE